MYILLSSEHTVYKVITRTLKQSSKTEKVSAELYFQHRRYMPEAIVFEQSQYITTAAYAAYAALNKLDWQQSFGAEIRLEANTGKEISFQPNSSSAGLGYALALALEWRKQLKKSVDISLDVFATGEVHASGRVSAVGHIETKVKAVLNTAQQHLVEGVVKPFVIFYPTANNQDISVKLKDNVKHLGGELVAVERLQTALFYLLGEQYDGDLANRFEPFKGLESFNFEDRFRFFGRDNALKKLISEYESSEGLFVVTGVSGAGKSSIVKAGLLPHIQDNTVVNVEFNYKIISLKQQSLEDLLLSLVKFLLPEKKEDKTLNQLVLDIIQDFEQGCIQLTQRIGTQNESRTVLFLDQYENIFNLSGINQTHITAFGILLDKLAKSIPSVSIIITIRSEYLHLLGSVGKDSHVSQQLSPDEWHEIVLKQAIIFGLCYEDNLVNTIVTDASRVNHALPVVEYLLTQLYRNTKLNNDTNNVLSLQAYQALGGITGVIANRAEKAICKSDLQPSVFFEYFIGLNDEGFPYANSVDIAEPEVVNSGLSHLIGNMLSIGLVIDSSTTEELEKGITKVKLTHDTLLNTTNGKANWQQMQDWLGRHKDYLQWFYSVKGNYNRWKQHQIPHRTSDTETKDSGFLLSAHDQLLANSFMHDGLINRQGVVFYINTSQQYLQQQTELKVALEQRRNRLAKMAIGLITALLFASLFATMTAFESKRIAEKSERKATETNVQLWNSKAQFAYTTQERIEAALKALSANKSKQSLKESIAIVNQYGTKPLEIMPRFNDCVNGNKKVVTSSQRGDLIVLVFDDASACTVNVKTQESINVQLHSGSNCGVIITDEKIVALSDNGRLITWLPGQAEPKVTKSINEFHQCLASSNDGKLVVITSKNGIHGLVDLELESTEWFNEIPIKGIAMAVDNYASWLVTKNEDKLSFYNLSTGKTHQGPNYTGDKERLTFNGQSEFLFVVDKNNNTKQIEVVSGKPIYANSILPGERLGASLDSSIHYRTYPTGEVLIEAFGQTINFFVENDSDKDFPIVNISGNNDKAYTINSDGLVRQFNINVSKKLRSHKHKISFMTFAQSKHLLASTDTSGDIVIWDMDNQSRFRHLGFSDLAENKHPLSADSSPVRHLAFINDDEEIVAVHANGVVNNWHVKSGQLQTSFDVESLQGFKTLVVDNVAGNIIWHTQENAIYYWQKDTQTTTPLLKGIDQIKFAFYNNDNNSFMLYTGSGDVEFSDELDDLHFTGDEKDYKFSIADKSLVELTGSPRLVPEAYWLRNTGTFSINHYKSVSLDGDQTAIFEDSVHGSDGLTVELGLGNTILFEKIIMSPDASYFISAGYDGYLHIWPIKPLYKSVKEYQQDHDLFRVN